MKDFFKKSVLGSIFLGFLLAGCTQAPKEVDGQPVEVVDTYFLYPLEINTDKEQQLYFRFKRQPDPKEDSYIISAVAIIPDEYETPNFFLNDILLKEKKMSFEMKLVHYDKEDKATPVGLMQYPIINDQLEYESNLNYFTNKKQFQGVRHLSFWYGIPEGYSGRSNGLAYFNPPAKGGYYHLSIRALQNYRDYPKMKLAVKIFPDVTK